MKKYTTEQIFKLRIFDVEKDVEKDFLLSLSNFPAFYIFWSKTCLAFK